eukprot:m.108500 g.108500  ORF g.108500 m.108500 type:complete len:167 (-) comp22632_c1_seq4:99-599(-)
MEVEKAPRISTLPFMELRPLINNVGTFSTVFKARFRLPSLRDRYVALKRIVFTCHPARVDREIACLKRLKGANNVARILAVMRHEDVTILVLDYFEHEYFQEYVNDMTIEDIRLYMHGLFTALKHVHQHNIVHRDIKPNNFLYNREKSTFLLVDFGLAQVCSDGLF